MSNITYKTEVITPKLAKEYLTKNLVNRKVKTEAVRSYARDMIRGDWKETGQTISFCEDGRLINGQHRLLAIIASQKPQRICVARNLPEDAIVGIDRGVSRTVRDVFDIELRENDSLSDPALSNSKIIAGLSALARYGAEQTLKSSRSKVSASDVKRLYEEFHKECNYIFENIVSKTTKITGPMVAAAIAALRNGVEPRAIQSFFLLLLKDDATGCDDHNINACLNWKKQLTEIKMAHARMDQGKALRGTEAAIYHFANGTKVSRVVIPKECKYDVSQLICNSLTRCD